MTAAGLPEEVALAALTTVPAELLGVERSLGTLEPGKIANLVVSDGALFDDESSVESVWVDGIEYEVERPEKPKGDPDAIVDPRGEWSVVIKGPSRSVQRRWTISAAAGGFVGTADLETETVDFDSVTLAGNLLTVIYPSRGGRAPMEVTLVVRGERFEGEAHVGEMTLQFEGVRTRTPDEDRP
jgi:hypothetical protein